MNPSSQRTLPTTAQRLPLVKVTNDILCALVLDGRQCVYLVLLDLSAAFDTIDHQVFLARLREDYGVTGGVADWMASYLTNRSQVIDINGTYSDKIKLEYGFPQGSKIGPFGFKLYTKPLAAIAKKHGVFLHLYADDTQLYLPFDPQNSKLAMQQMEACITEIQSWMASNFLKLNAEKTEFIMLGTKQDVLKISERTVSVGDEEVLPSETVRDIGAMIDSSLTMKAHINSITKSCYAQIRSLSKIRKYLTEDSSKTISHAFVSSRLDIMNALLFDLPKTQLNRLQAIQNHTARIVKNEHKKCHITPLLIDLHWLPIEFRIHYKILLLVFKCLHGRGPAYLASMLQEYHPSRSLRSADHLLLIEPKVQKKYGDRAFSVCGPKLWNTLPLCIKNSPSVASFKKVLKTHLFKQAYNL